MSDPLGADPGKVNDLASSGLTNGYTDIPDQSVEAIADRVAPRQVATGMTRGIQQLGSEKVYSDGGNNQIIVEDSNEPRVLMGNQATFGEGFYVTKDGFNAKTNTNAANFIFNSNQNILKVATTGTSTYTLNVMPANSSATVTVAHGLAVIPAFQVFCTLPAFPGSVATVGVQLMPAFVTLQDASGLGAILLWCTARADITNLYIDIINPSSGTITNATPLSFKYYILQETAT